MFWVYFKVGPAPHFSTSITNSLMKTKIIFIVLILTGPVVLSQKNDTEILKKMNADWLNSYPTKDKTTLARIFADDFVLISHNGIKMTKKDIIDNLDKQETKSVHIDSMDIRLLTRDVGVVTAYTTFTLKADGKEITGQNCYQDIYQKRKGKWKAVTAHVTLLSLK